MMSLIEQNSLREKLRQKGLDKVKEELKKGIYGDARGKKAFVEHYINTQEKIAAKNIKEQELGLHNEANQIAKQENIISWLMLAQEFAAFIFSIVLFIN